MKAAEALPDAIVLLRAAGVPDPVRDARLLLAFAAGWPTDRISLHLQDRLDAKDLVCFTRAIAARAARQPLSQITGQRLFFGRSFHVSPDVLDPRPETETLVMAALAQRVMPAAEAPNGWPPCLRRGVAPRCGCGCCMRVGFGGAGMSFVSWPASIFRRLSRF